MIQSVTLEYSEAILHRLVSIEKISLILHLQLSSRKSTKEKEPEYSQYYLQQLLILFFFLFHFSLISYLKVCQLFARFGGMYSNTWLRRATESNQSRSNKHSQTYSRLVKWYLKIQQWKGMHKGFLSFWNNQRSN